MERLLTNGLIVGIPLITACILYAICRGPFIRMNHKKELPDVRTLTEKYDKIHDKRKQRAWLRIHSEIVYAAKHGKRHASIYHMRNLKANWRVEDMFWRTILSNGIKRGLVLTLVGRVDVYAGLK